MYLHESEASFLNVSNKNIIFCSVCLFNSRFLFSATTEHTSSLLASIYSAIVTLTQN